MVLIADPDRDSGSIDAQGALLGEPAPRLLEAAAADLVMSREWLATLSRAACWRSVGLAEAFECVICNGARRKLDGHVYGVTSYERS